MVLRLLPSRILPKPKPLPLDRHKNLPECHALIIGISYKKDAELQGKTESRLDLTHHDANIVKECLLQQGFPIANITVMIDDNSVAEDLWPSHSNMSHQLSNFVKPNRPNARYVVWYAGHSTQVESDDGFRSESDGKDECLMPCAEKHAKVPAEDHILDDDLRRWLVDNLHPTSSLLAVFDTCHSGTMLDLPFFIDVRKVQKKQKGRNVLRRSQVRRTPTDIGSTISGLMGKASQLVVSHLSSATSNMMQSYNLFHEQGRVICISACQDSQQVPETEDLKTMTQVLVKTLYAENGNPTINDILNALRLHRGQTKDLLRRESELKGRKFPRPQLSSLQVLDFRKHERLFQ